MIERYIRPPVVEALRDTRVVLVMGARQVGKSTLCEAIADLDHPAVSVSLDDQAARRAALSDPRGFLAGFEGPVFIDEVQRAPELILAIKQVVDRDRQPGRFLLTGSANILSSRKVQEALTGRIEIARLWAFAQAEVELAAGNFVDSLFAGSAPRVADAPIGRQAFASRVAAGGYPEARLRQGRRRDRWFANYLTTTLERDLQAIADLQKEHEMPRLLSVLATRSSNLLQYANVARELELDEKTVKSYISLLEAIFLVRLVPAWRPSFLQRILHSPKVYITDSGLLAHLLGADEQRIADDDRVTGIALETFVATEIMKHASWSGTDPRIYHFRDRRGAEVDLVLEDRSGRVVAIEVKAKVSLGKDDSKGLEKLRAAAGSRFTAGAVIHAGDQTLPLGDRLWALPVSALWAGTRPPPRPDARRPLRS
ncbi:MAG: ATP-binding protein [Thermoleophilaceae bacterium]